MVTFALNRADRKDIRDREIPSHRLGGRRCSRRGRRRCDVACIRSRVRCPCAAGGVWRTAAAGSGGGRANSRPADQRSQRAAESNVPFASKSYLVEGGVGGVEGRIADRQLQKAARNGSLPLTFNVANITPAGPGAASADITASGPNLAPTTQNITFVNQGGWKLSRGSAMSLLQAVQAAG
ncbi:low molecular weight antigen MTB12 [Mycobacterium xenopi 4042]|uniref:Low molecular weight antigen MTB12 n=1 Tax=Mycobacterium xenopi 4042 TaxID=1299334 RepID=X8BFY2_MYCXE|nr:low molecular weight antigen MTB12 [Mycobacterium xenopi 4042]